ncbi:LOW QUALITY PROTEIN: hypothetical protein PHMEG_00024277 [Phytophthora megakarya]|uniref:Retrotransposon gag domain-containing protein n=1 Tax=Phytophthora megakarya TaxID=4795 RepID=A0A225VFK8_9STRA|nr:LOW QUALITY PROTEIN: hypothetical protein PHMEG_00024277 [Phytophthora megakarya]
MDDGRGGRTLDEFYDDAPMDDHRHPATTAAARTVIWPSTDDPTEGTHTRGASESSSEELESSDEISPSDESHDYGERHGRREYRQRRRERGHERRAGRWGTWPKRKNVKDLELPTFTPSPKVSVSTWIDRVDLVLKGAAESGRERWSHKSLYFILGNNLMDKASKWWVDMDRRMPERKRTWKNLKSVLLCRYGEKLDKSTAEWRVNTDDAREIHADFAAGLRDVLGRNKVSDRVLFAQFYRNLDKTTKKLVIQKLKPRMLEEAVEKATEIDDPMDNVAQ